MNQPLAGRKVVVIGGGVIGATCAYYLAKAGGQVAVVERGEFGKGCSHANCGLVCPSHVLPLAGPGVIAESIQALLRKNSPFRIQPRLDPALWSWLLHFARRCNQRDMLESGRAIQTLLNSSRALYDDLFGHEPLDAEWETRGVLFVFRSAAALEHHAKTNQLLHEKFGLVSTRHDGESLIELEPALIPGLAGGWHYHCDAHLRPDKLMGSWRRLLIGLGVEVHEQCEFRGFEQHAGRATAANTAGERHAADAFVLATGAWTPQLNLRLGCRIPIQPGKGYSVTMPRPGRCPAMPLVFEEDRVVVTPMKSAYRLGSIMELAGYDSALRPERLEWLSRAARQYLHEATSEPVLESWYGWRPMTYDSVPIIDRSPAMENVYLAIGHNMLGLSMAPATGRLVSELLGETQPHIDPAPYSVSRFG